MGKTPQLKRKRLKYRLTKNRSLRIPGWSMEYGIFTILFTVLIFSSCEPSQTEEQEAPLFELLPPQTTGIYFNNQLTPNDTVNIVNFEYMFNGAGVGVGDFDNDGLKDLYFTGNQVADKLYRNLGNWKFEDITEKAGIASRGWSNGVALTDINEDGFLDIYVSHGGLREWPWEQWANEFYINQGDGTFKEMAEAYGIADRGFSVQSVFFDYDKDGDRDLYVLTNALVDYNRNSTRRKVSNGSAMSTDRLYRNNGDGSFTDISREAGINEEGFGLGVSLCDINEDGWLDLYISNDFLTDDLLWVNNQDGTFSNQIKSYLKHTSYNGMGNDLGDLNNDGKEEMITVDMFPGSNSRIKQTVMKPSLDVFSHNIELGYNPQYMRNTLQLNNGNQSFSEIGQYSGIYNTDWSWAPLIADYDNDGFNDIFITNGYRRDITNLDYLDYTLRPAKYATEADLVRSELQRVEGLPEVKIPNYIYRNNGDLTFTEMVDQWGMEQPLYSNGAAYADLDNDGDLDLVVNNIDDAASLYRNNLKERVGESEASYLGIDLVDDSAKDISGAQIWGYSGSKVYYRFASAVRGYLSSMESELHFGLGNTGQLDSLKVRWNDGTEQVLYGVSANQVVQLNKAEAKQPAPESEKLLAGDSSGLFTEVAGKLGVNYVHAEDNFDEFKVQTTLLKMNTNLGPGTAVGDVNGDGLEDFYVGGTKVKPGAFYIQEADGTFSHRILACNGGAREDMGVALADLDGDGDLDLVSVDGGGIEEMALRQYRDVVYYNDGSGNFSCRELLRRKSRGGSVALADYDRDGDLDIFIAGRVINGFYPRSPESFLLENEGGNFKDVTQSILGTRELGMISDALWTDIDNDDWMDLILVGEFMEITFLKNFNGNLQDVTRATGLEMTSGWWNSIVPGDFDGDGDMDYALGNFGLNSDFKSSPEQPLTIYVGDFDGNGKIDPLISCYREGEEHLIHTRDVLISQISAMKGTFRNYDNYANADFEEVREAIGLDKAETLKAYTFASAYLENLGGGKFKRTELPQQVQYSSVFGMLPADYNGDGNLDLLVSGNQYDIEPFIGQNDASIGYCLLGDGAGNFEVVPASESGLALAGSAKGIALLQMGDETPVVISGMNSTAIRMHAYETGGLQTLQVNTDDAYAILYHEDGSMRKVEFTYGNTYLGSNSRDLRFPSSGIKRIEVVSFTGERREVLPALGS